MTGFRFLDDADAQRQLGVDRITFEELLRTKRLRPVSTSGENIHFFRVADVARLRAELYPEGEEAGAAEADALTAAPASTAPSAKKKRDPAVLVHNRLIADLKWYDISDEDVRAWFNQLRPESYDRHRANAHHLIARMEQIQALIDEGEARLRQEEQG